MLLKCCNSKQFYIIFCTTSCNFHTEFHVFVLIGQYCHNIDNRGQVTLNITCVVL